MKIKFLYVISPEQYKKKGLLKYIPEKYTPKIKLKLLTAMRNEKGDIIGKAIGVFLTYKDLSNDQYIEAIIKGVEKYRDEDVNNIVFEDRKILDDYKISIIEKETGLKIINGKKVLIRFLPLVLKKIFWEIGEESINYEILLISSGKENIKPLIKEFSRMIRFLTVYVEDEKKISKVKEDIFSETGLSIHYTKNIDKTLANYYIIINLSNTISLNVDKFKYKSIVFDFSSNNKVSKEIKIKNKECIVIEDFIFWNNNLFLVKDNAFELGGDISSNLYEVNNNFNEKDFKGLMLNGREYSIEELVKRKIKARKIVST